MKFPVTWVTYSGCLVVWSDIEMLGSWCLESIELWSSEP